MFRFLTLLLLTGCGPSLVLYTDYHTHRDLASYNVGTPDPILKTCDCKGQDLVFEWTIPKALLARSLWVETYIRLRDASEHWHCFPILCVSGHTRWGLWGEEYFSTGGIFTFYATLYADGEPIKTVIHPLYTPLISILSDP